MDPELEERLRNASREDLVQLLEELSVRHPVLLTEMMSILESLPGGSTSTEDNDEEATEDWDFNGDEQALTAIPTHSTLPPRDSESQQERVEEFARRLRQEESPQVLYEVLRELVEEAISTTGLKEEYAALDIFAILIDERLMELNPITIPLFDEMIDAGMYALEAVLTEASSNTLLDKDTAALSPFLNTQIRHCWLERLFALWLKRLDAHRVEEDLPELLLNVAWSEDILLLRSLVQSELQKQPQTAQTTHTNIVDFSYQYRTKALEKFLKELPRT